MNRYTCKSLIFISTSHSPQYLCITPPSILSNNDSFPHARGLFIKDQEDHDDPYSKWLKIPHPEPQIDCYIAELRALGHLPDEYYDEWWIEEEELAAAMSEEQKKRFPLVVCITILGLESECGYWHKKAQECDILAVMAKLEAFKRDLEEILEMLRAEEADATQGCYWNPRDFR